MKKYLGLGSNEGDRQENLISCLKKIAKICEIKRVSSCYETPALLPDGAKAYWDKSYLNLVVEIESSDEAIDFLKKIKNIERFMKRESSARWSPRVIDIDILTWGEQECSVPDLKVPHPELKKRPFVLDPLKDLDVSFLNLARTHKGHQPQVMSIYNLTPDSFSDGGALKSLLTFESRMKTEYEAGVSLFDFGAESTRPGAVPISQKEEWKRLCPYLEIYKEIFSGNPLRPKLSLDSRYVETAEKALGFGVDIVNDVSGLTDPNWIAFLKETSVDYILMHSLSVPAQKQVTFSQSQDPVWEIKHWAEHKIDKLLSAGVEENRIIFDPGVGFGKSSLQSQKILRNIQQFFYLPVRILVGHSRKSFLPSFSSKNTESIALETLGVSLHLAEAGVDVLRVHDSLAHLKALKGWCYVRG